MRRVWRAPLAMGLLSVIGLLSALFADGPGDAVSWATLAIPVAAVCWFLLRPR